MRLPTYHRLDLRATRRLRAGSGELDLFLDIFNAYNRHNSFGYSYNTRVSNNIVGTSRTMREMLPLVPTIGARWTF